MTHKESNTMQTIDLESIINKQKNTQIYSKAGKKNHLPRPYK